MTRLLLLAFALLLHSAAQADRALQVVDDSAPTDKRVALVIGNASYKDSPLKNPVNDARAVAGKLRGLGFDVVEKHNLTQRQIGATLREFRTRLSPGGTALFFYAGHGLQVGGVNYLPAVDADIGGEEDVPTQAIDVNKVLGVMEGSKTRVNLVFLDACRNNPYARSFRSAGEGLAKISAPSGSLIFYATRPGSVAADGEGGNGLYTQHLLAALDQPGLTAEQVQKRVAAGVKQGSRGRQEPWMEGLLEGEFYFQRGKVRPEAIVSATPSMEINGIALDLAYWQGAQQTHSIQAYEDYLRQYPRGRFSGQAEAAIAKLKQESQTVTSAPLVTASAPSHSYSSNTVAAWNDQVIVNTVRSGNYMLDNSITVDAPGIAENGAVVPVTVSASRAFNPGERLYIVVNDSFIGASLRNR